MSLRIKIKERLKVKYPNVNLRRFRVNAIADALEEDLEDEATDEEIDTQIDRVNKFMDFAKTAKADDELTTFRKGKEDGPDEDPKTDPKTDEPAKVDPKTKTDQPDFEAILGKFMAPVLQEIASLKADKVSGTRTEKLNTVLAKSDDKFKKTTLAAFKRMKFETDEEFEEYLEELTETAADFIQADADDKLDKSVLPIMGAKSKSGVSSDTVNFIAAKTAAAKGEGGLAGKALSI